MPWLWFLFLWAAVSPDVSSRPSQEPVRLLVAAKDGENLYAWFVSNQPMDQPEIVSRGGDGGISVVMACNESAELYAETEQAELNSEELVGQGFERTQLLRLMKGRPQGNYELGVQLHQDGRAGFRGSGCNRGVVLDGRGVLVTAVGISKQAAMKIAAIVNHEPKGVQATLLELQDLLPGLWPLKVPMHALWFLAVRPERPREELSVLFDRGGQAARQLERLHQLHTGQVQLPFLLARAMRLRDDKQKKLATSAATSAVQAGKTAVAARPAYAPWQAALALAQALQMRKSDEAVRQINQAIKRAPASTQVLRLATWVFRLRGDLTTADALLAELRRLEKPIDPEPEKSPTVPNFKPSVPEKPTSATPQSQPKPQDSKEPAKPREPAPEEPEESLSKPADRG